MKNFLGIVILITTLSSCQVFRGSAEIDDLTQIDNKVWRSSQPREAEFSQLQQKGIRHIVSLRRFHRNDPMRSSSTSQNGTLTMHHVPMRAGNLDEQDLVRALKCIHQCEGPTLVHCWHGADRTGAVIAAYRMVDHGWTAEKAIAELHDPRFGHHASVYPNIEKLLRELDVSSLRRELGASTPLTKKETTLR